jgi:transposase InsO family protein
VEKALCDHIAAIALCAKLKGYRRTEASRAKLSARGTTQHYEHLNYQKFSSKEAAKLSIIDYIAFYNGNRMHSVLNYKSPLAYEKEYYKQIA